MLSEMVSFKLRKKIIVNVPVYIVIVSSFFLIFVQFYLVIDEEETRFRDHSLQSSIFERVYTKNRFHSNTVLDDIHHQRKFPTSIIKFLSISHVALHCNS